MLPLLLYFNKCINILHTFSRIFDHFHHVGIYTVNVFHLFLAFYHILKELRQLHFNDKKIQKPAVEQVLKEIAPPPDKFIQQVREQLTISFHKEVLAPSDEFIRQVKEQLTISFHTYEAELPTSHQFDILSTHSPTSPVMNNNRTISNFIECEERCSKFINQDLNFLQSSNISSVSNDVLPEDNSSVKVSQSQTKVVSSNAKIPTHTPENQNSTPPTQIVKPV